MMGIFAPSAADIGSAVAIAVAAEMDKRSSIEDPKVPISDARIVEFLGLQGISATGISVTIEKALGVPAIWAAVNFLSGSLAHPPFNLFKKDAKGGREKVRGGLATILHDAVNDETSSFDWRKLHFDSVFTGGRAFTFIEKNAVQKVSNLWPLDPDRTTVKRVDGRKVYEHRDGKKTHTYVASEIIDQAFMLKSDGLRHRSPIMAKLSPPDCYDVIFGHREGRLPKRLTSMTLGEVIDAQKGWGSKAWVKKNWGYGSASSASGAAQFMRDTLIDLSKKFFLQGDQPLDGDFQDRMAFELLKRRGYNDFIASKISRTEFGKRLAQEWASFPVLAPTEGQHRNVARGESFYAGDALNKSLVSPAKVEAVLDAVKALASAPEPEVPTTPPTGPIPPDYPVYPPAPLPPAEVPKPAFDFFAWLLSFFRR